MADNERKTGVRVSAPGVPSTPPNARPLPLGEIPSPSPPPDPPPPPPPRDSTINFSLLPLALPASLPLALNQREKLPVSSPPPPPPALVSKSEGARMPGPDPSVVLEKKVMTDPPRILDILAALADAPNCNPLTGSMLPLDDAVLSDCTYPLVVTGGGEIWRYSRESSSPFPTSP